MKADARQLLSLRRQCAVHRGALRVLSRQPGLGRAEVWRDYFDKLQNPARRRQLQRARRRPRAGGRLLRPACQARHAARRAHGHRRRQEAGQAVLQLINAYRFLGNRWAQLDPLKRSRAAAIPELDPAHYGFTEADLGQSFATGSFAAAPERGHPARDPRGAAPDLLRHHRRRVHVPLGGRRRSAGSRPRLETDPLDAGLQRRGQEALPAHDSPRPRRWSATCTPATSARSASRWRAASR
jgi:hypothetical protein